MYNIDSQPSHSSKVMLQETIHNIGFLVQHSIAILLRHCFEWLQHCSKKKTLCCTKFEKLSWPIVPHNITFRGIQSKNTLQRH